MIFPMSDRLLMITAIVLGAILITVTWIEASPETAANGGTWISGQVTAADDGKPVAGAILVERGRLYGKNFRYGDRIGEDGRFSVKVEGGGDYGIHLYASGYIYFPLGIRVEEGMDNHGTYKLPPNPAAGDAPVISNVRFRDSGRELVISLSVSDPNRNLSHQVLAFNVATRKGFRMKPPRVVFPWTKNYPDGVYTLRYSPPGDVSGGDLAPENWYFVAADNRCYNSPVMKYPFTAGSLVVAKTAAESLIPGQGREPVVEERFTSGEGVFNDNCTMCHYRDSTKTKVGPGLKGIFSRKTSPVAGFPVTEDNIRKQITRGGENMPPYGYLSEPEVEAVIEYLKTL